MHWLTKYPGLRPDQDPGAGFDFSYSIGNDTYHLGCQKQQLPRDEHPAWESKGSQTLFCIQSGAETSSRLLNWYM